MQKISNHVLSKQEQDILFLLYFILSSINARSRYIRSIFFACCFAIVMYCLFSGCSLVACICVDAILVSRVLSCVLHVCSLILSIVYIYIYIYIYQSFHTIEYFRAPLYVFETYTWIWIGLDIIGKVLKYSDRFGQDLKGFERFCQVLIRFDRI